MMVFDPGKIRFASAEWLPLLVASALLLLLWIWRFSQRQRDRHRLATAQTVLGASPARRRLPIFGDLLAWLFVILALASIILALARPLVVTSSVRTAGVDLVILQDGSASMRVQDVRMASAGSAPVDRWQRSMQFLRIVGESLRWEGDRIALALFANVATPQIRLTRDPNTFFFFLDHLEDAPPFRLQDVGTWDTNIERGIYWGLRLIEKDEEIFGPSQNTRAFVLVSDGQAWSGKVEASLAKAQARKIPVHVVGVGTTAGGMIPEPERGAGVAPVASSLDRNSLAVIATAARGRYFELDREKDTEIANGIIVETRRRAPQTPVAEGVEELYPQCLFAAAVFLLGAFASRIL
jgi:Ca-activated chloride channel family protein